MKKLFAKIVKFIRTHIGIERSNFLSAIKNNNTEFLQSYFDNANKTFIIDESNILSIFHHCHKNNSLESFSVIIQNTRLCNYDIELQHKFFLDFLYYVEDNKNLSFIKIMYTENQRVKKKLKKYKYQPRVNYKYNQDFLFLAINKNKSIIFDFLMKQDQKLGLNANALFRHAKENNEDFFNTLFKHRKLVNRFKKVFPAEFKSYEIYATIEKLRQF